MGGMKMTTTSCRCGTQSCVLLKHCFNPFLEVLVSCHRLVTTGCPWPHARTRASFLLECSVLGVAASKSWQRLSTPGE